MVYRIYVEKRPELANEAKSLQAELQNLLGIKGLKKVRVLNRYDAENITDDLFQKSVSSVFSEPQLDIVYTQLPKINGYVLAVEYLPGQFDQRANSAAECIQILSCGDRPLIRTARIYLLEGTLSEDDLTIIRHHVINPVEAREASLELPSTLSMDYTQKHTVATLEGFCEYDRNQLADFVKNYGLAMDVDDIEFCRDYFRKEGRNPTITEIRMIDTYWSDHCRHTTFLTTIDKVSFDDPVAEATYRDYLDTRKYLGRTKPINLMDIGTIAAKYLKKTGQLTKLDESEEINACTVKISVERDGKKEPWLLLFKNETHNHPTEIEPFGGAATCIGGAIRDPLSGRSYVYAAMRVTGAADPTLPVSSTIPGKLPQRKIVQTAAAGYSSYGNQIGLATGIVDEVYHPGYAAKRMEIGAVIAATPADHVRRETPEEGDVVILLGGRTGRDGIGGATGSSKAHDSHSVETCGAEVQKGNAPEERKLQRLFRRADACRMIRRCNDFGAGGVSVAIGELADGLLIDLDKVPKKYEGLDGTELAISESQERMAVVVEDKDSEAFLRIASEENLEATIVAKVTAEPRLRMIWQGNTIVDVSREFLNSNGAEKHIEIEVPAPQTQAFVVPDTFESGYRSLLGNLNVCSKRGLSERFDSTIGAGTVLMPFGGKYQKSPIQSMVHKISMEAGETSDCSFMSWGYNPTLSSLSPYRGAYLAVVESISKLVASGAAFEDVYLTFQEYFEKPGRDGKRWGQPMAALLGAFRAQKEFGVAAIGGKDSMSGSFEKLDVPPTLVSFAVTTGKVSEVISTEAKSSGHKIVWLCPDENEDGLPDITSLKKLYSEITRLMREKRVYSAWTPTYGGVAEGVYKMIIGNGFGFDFVPSLTLSQLFKPFYGSFLLEVDKTDSIGTCIGEITDNEFINWNGSAVSLKELNFIYEGKLEDVYPMLEKKEAQTWDKVSFENKSRFISRQPVVRPKVLIPVFPGTNCEFDSARAVRDAGGDAEIFVINNLSKEGIARSVETFAAKVADSQMIFIPGGFSGGDEPDGSGKFIMAFFRNEEVKTQVHRLLENRDGLMCGICNGFQALVKLGLVPYGKIMDPSEDSPTLTFNNIARHQSKLVRVRVSSNNSPWLRKVQVGDIITVPISHGEGKFIVSEKDYQLMVRNGQIATQYVDLNGEPTDDIRYNPNGSYHAIEGILSPDGRVFGKMGHSERVGNGLYRNVEGEYQIHMFESAVSYFKNT